VKKRNHMKVSPIPQGNNLGNVQTSAPSPDKVAAAKAAFNGESPTTITKSDTYMDPQAIRTQESIRKIKLRTNQTPAGREYVPEQQESSEGPIGDTTVQTQATTEDTKPLSPQFAALARQKRALQVKERELADRERAMQSQTPTNGAEDVIARLKSQPLSVLQEYGVTYDQLTEAILANQSGINPEIQALKAELKALKEGVDKTFSDKDAQAVSQVLAEMRREADTLSKQGDAYEMVRETASVPQVIELIHRTYKQTGEILEVSEAMQLVEDELINETMKIANINKIKSKFVTNEQPQQEPEQTPRGTMRTLTNRDNARPTLDRKARALAAFHGINKK
jgi:hypothetical protein